MVYAKWQSKAVGNETKKDAFSIGFSDIVTTLSRKRLQRRGPTTEKAFAFNIKFHCGTVGGRFVECSAISCRGLRRAYSEYVSINVRTLTANGIFCVCHYSVDRLRPRSVY